MNFDRESFVLDLLNIEWNQVITIEINNPNKSFNLFFDKIDSLVNQYIPLRKLTKKEIKNKFKPWIMSGIRNSMKRRDKIYKKFIKTSQFDIKQEYELQYKTLRNQIVKLCRDSKSIYFQSFFRNNASNIKNTWKGINKIINVSSENRNTPSLIVNNKLISEPVEAANKFNEYFSTIAENLQAKIYDTGTDIHQYDRNENSIFIQPTNPLELIRIINNLNANKASGPYSIDYEILHLIKLIIAEPLSRIINLSFEKAKYFENLKISKAIPVYKGKGSDLDRGNYWPISLLSNINKIVEKLMYNRLHSFLS